MIEELLPDPALFLGKGVLWLALCGLLGWLARKFHRGPGSARAALLGLALLSLGGLLPALWTWEMPPPAQVPPPEPLVVIRPARQAVPVPPAPVATVADSTPHWHLDWEETAGLVWLAGAVAVGFWLLHGFRVSRRWARRALLVTDAAWLDLLDEECRLLGVRRAPRLLLSADISGPCVTGCRRPVILLPAASQDWPEATRRETPFTVAALPGKPYRLRINTEQPDAFLEITCQGAL